jgi:protein TonB
VTSGAAIKATAPTQPPGYGQAGLANPPPRYPWLARQKGEQGRVLVRVQVDREGRAAHVELARSSGHGRLDRAALRALRQWRFTPARRAGAAVPGVIDVPVTFRLSDSR